MRLSLKETDRDLDLKVLSLGAGVQSSTVLLKMLNDEIPKADIAIFADTGNEPKAVYEYLEYLKKLSINKIPIYTAHKSNIVKDALSEESKGTNKGFLTMPVYGRKPDGKKTMGRRQCTSDYKIRPIHKKIREVMGIKSLKGRVIEISMGISTDEIQRAKRPTFQWAINYYPLLELDMSRDDCKQYVKQNKTKQPPRSACIVCPYHSNEEWSDMKENYPEEFNEAVAFDRAIRDIDGSGVKNYLHSSLIPLEDVNFKDKVDIYSGSLFDDECEGMCGV